MDVARLTGRDPTELTADDANVGVFCDVCGGRREISGRMEPAGGKSWLRIQDFAGLQGGGRPGPKKRVACYESSLKNGFGTSATPLELYRASSSMPSQFAGM